MLEQSKAQQAASGSEMPSHQTDAMIDQTLEFVKRFSNYDSVSDVQSAREVFLRFNKKRNKQLNQDKKRAAAAAAAEGAENGLNGVHEDDDDGKSNSKSNSKSGALGDEDDDDNDGEEGDDGLNGPIEPFEIAQLNNLRINEAEEAFTLIQSLGAKRDQGIITDDDVELLLEEVKRFQKN
eukprot:TRINITY_DN50732_c0_g1_i1.p1 TRINITY_DN50732_c0_g1~~TRINITY_DN50732_c0_g1_i1.p1  ORF type:complete len:180 (+),score=109.80 TRINITY_DN50732_c0_g1_i1:158-697(+)